MKQIKKIFFGFVALMMLLVTAYSAVSVNAAKVNIIRDDNRSGVVVISLYDTDYYIDINEDTNIGYVIVSINGEEETLGTCTITVIDEENQSRHVLCSEGEDSLGCMTLVITNEETNEGYISIVTGEMSNLFNVNQIITIEE